LAHLRLSFRRAEIDHNGFLAAIAAVEIGSGVLTIVVDKRRAPLAGIIALRAFHLNDLGPQVGQCLTGQRARKDPRQFNYFQACKRLHAMSFRFR
jgi:hypothetical protein